ncbi:hypothetical protein DBR06_SOUSAS8310075, partial [Sousa chinensis]
FKHKQDPVSPLLKPSLSFGTSLVVQQLRLHAPNVGVPGSIPGQGTRSHMPQIKDSTCGKEDPTCCN